MLERDKQIGAISRNSLECIEAVASDAEQELLNYKSIDAGALAAVNTFNDIRQINRIGQIDGAARSSLQDLIREPVIGRVSYEDEDGNERVIFVTRASPRIVKGFKNIASYRSDVGRIASLPAGEEIQIRIGGRDQYVTIRSTTKLRPVREAGAWDSRNSEIEFETLGKVTVASLRALLEPVAEHFDEDLLEALLAEDETPNVMLGLRRSVLSHIMLRDQPILDRHQDEIFRLGIDSRCFLSGPPGTGKTTTLIRRLGQKLDLDALAPGETALIRRAQQDNSLDHQKSWLMFSPTELLRQYVKEAFAREGVAASDEHISTWTEYRRNLARNVLGILRTGTGKGQFVERANDAYLDPRCGTSEAANWYEDFDQYFRAQLFNELKADAGWLSSSKNDDLAKLGRKIAVVLDRHDADFGGAEVPEIAGFGSEIEALLEQRKAESDKILTLSLNRLLHADREFLDSFAKEVSRQPIALDDLDEDEADSDFDDEEETDNLLTRTVNRKQARIRYERVIRAHANAKAKGRRVSEQSNDGRLLGWLGESRIPDEEQLKSLARIIAEQTRLRKFARIDTLFMKSVSRLFKKYRKERAKDGAWYVAEPDRPSDISWKEIDLLILSMLRTAGAILSAYERSDASGAQDRGVFGRIKSAYRNQILVDEASDFSIIQLASMYELSHPLIRSFFACGDFNQRLTEWGITSKEDLEWVCPRIEHRSITIAYRQSGKLVDFAKRVAALGGSKESDIVLPDRVDIEGVSPVWRANLATKHETAAWLAERIGEIEIMVDSVPSIAVLVGDESQVEPLAALLNEHLQDRNIAAVPCKDGKVVGNDRDVRVFDIQHIKGLEFEAVFFVGLDEIVASKPALFAKFLYVGATRAATYLCITFNSGVLEEVASLTDMFTDSWLE